MTKRARIIRNIAIGLGAAIVVILVAAVVVVRTDWFRDYVKQQIVNAAEEGTGGKVEIGSFSLQLSRLRAVVTDFTIHGNEPAVSAPYLRARRAEVNLRLLASPKHLVNIAYLGLDRPEANIIVFPDGHTNVPTPKRKSPPSNTSPTETVVDLAAGHFELTNGSFSFNSHKEPLDLRGNNLRVRLAYDTLKQ